MKPASCALAAGFPLLAEAMGAAAGLTLSAGTEYSTGNYGATQATDIRYVPLTGEYATGPFMLRLALSYVSITGPGNVVGPRDAVLVTPGATTPRRTASGLGDVVATGRYNIHQDPARGLLVDLTGKIKFATADAVKGLGTGENDYSVQIDMAKQFGRWTAFGTLGWRKMGDPAGIDLRDPWFGSLGAGLGLSAATQVGATYDIRQRVIDGGPRLSELMLFVSHKLAPAYTLQGYAVQGFADGSPSWGAGASLSRRF